MKRYNTQAFVLKNIKYKDADKIFTLFSKDLGKISALARGVRKISSRRAGNLDTLNLVSISIRENPNAFNDIEEVKTLESYKDLKKSLKKSLKAYYLIELVHKSIEEGEKNEELFNLLQKSLKLMQKTSDPDFVVSYFEMHLMNLLGYKMTLDKCRVCGKAVNKPWERYSFNVENGSFECEKCSKYGIGVSREAALGMLCLYNSKTTSDLRGYISEIDKIMKIYIGRKLESRFKSLEIDQS
jgi:DNA repair protein RecO (recombination protein O)